MGVCNLQCAAGFGDCDLQTASGCETTLQNNIAACGVCGNACAGGTPFCAVAPGGASCVSGCAAGQVRCGGAWCR